jgi:hypothetical protein
VITISVFVRSTDGRTPDCVPVIRAEVRYHDDDGIACCTAFAGGPCRRRARGG